MKARRVGAPSQANASSADIHTARELLEQDCGDAYRPTITGVFIASGSEEDFFIVPLGVRHEIRFSCIARAACCSFSDRLSPIKNTGHATHGAATQSQSEPAGGCLNNGQSNGGGQWLTTGLAVALVITLLSACGGMRQIPGNNAHKVELNGVPYQVEQITASTWTATTAAGVPNSAQHNLALVRAIEKESGCKVTDSSVGQQGTAMIAQVDCGSRLKN